MRSVDEGTLDVFSGSHEGERDIPFFLDISGPLNPGRQASTPDLSTLTPCITGDTGTSEQFPLDLDSVHQLDLDDSYVGANVTVTDTWTETVWMNPVQLSKR